MRERLRCVAGVKLRVLFKKYAYFCSENQIKNSR